MNRNPNRITLSRRKTLAALGSIGAASAVAGLGTSAFFSDQEALTNNSLVAGELDLKVAATSHYVDWLPAGNGPGETNDAGMPGGSEDSDLVLEAGPNQSDAWPIELEIDDATGFAEGSVAETANGGADVDGSLCSGDNDADEAVLVDLDDVKPGDFGLLRFAFESCTNPAFLWFRGSLDSARENDVTEPEAEDPDERDGVVELLDAVRVAAIPGDAVDRLESNADDSGDDPTLEVAGEMSLREFLAGRPTMPLDGDISAPEGSGAEGARNCFAGETVHSYTFIWWLPVDHANQAQTDSATFSIGFYAEQCRHNDGQLGKQLSLLGRYESGIYDEGGAEIASYDPGTERVFVINADAGQADVLDVSDPANPTKVGSIDPSGDLPEFTVGGVNSVDTQDGTVALAVEADGLSADGRVAFYEATGSNSFLGSAPLGPLPDLVKFAPDGDTVLVANEGEPSDDYSTDPEGSVSVVDVSSGFGSASEAKADFTGFDAATLRSKGVRIFGPGASAAQDLEPESVVAGPDSETAYVFLQENNAVAILDISDTSNPTVEEVVPLGYKNHSLPGNELDAVDDGNIDIRNEPLFGMYRPDVLETAEIDGERYLVTASEGDAREYEGLFETGVLTGTGGGDFKLVIDDEDISGGSATADVDIDESAFSAGVLSRLEDLEVTARPPGNGDNDPGTVSELYLFGGRSYMILDSDGNIVFERGSQLERIVRDSDEVPDQQFNAENDEINDSDDDSESEASGPEPEGVAVGQVGDQTRAFVGLEEVGGVAAFDISSPSTLGFVDYINSRDFSVGPEDDIEDGSLSASAAGDLGPEGIEFVSAVDSPTDDALLVGHEVSGTTTLYRVG